MSDRWGQQYRIHIFGESHGPGVGVVIDGMEPGIRWDEAYIQTQLRRRRPGGALVSARNEEDVAQILSGVYNGYTTGTSITCFISNQDAKRGDYVPDRLRPSQADYSGQVKYHGFADPSGGGHFSGRLTAGLVLAGAAAELALRTHTPYQAGSHIIQIGTAQEERFTLAQCDPKVLHSLQTQSFPVLDAEARMAMQGAIEEARAAGDSVGGCVETAVTGLTPGLGDPFFDSLESRLAHLLFSIPAVKSVSFGDGEAFASMKGSAAADHWSIKDGTVRTEENHNGGLLGGITTGMPLVFQTTFKPTPTLGQSMEVLHLESLQTETVCFGGRHDPCIVPRGLPVAEACAAIAVYDAWLEAHGHGYA